MDTQTKVQQYVSRALQFRMYKSPKQKESIKFMKEWENDRFSLVDVDDLLPSVVEQLKQELGCEKEQIRELIWAKVQEEHYNLCRAEAEKRRNKK